MGVGRDRVNLHLHAHQPELLLLEAHHVQSQHTERGLAAPQLAVQACLSDGQRLVALEHP